jgi:clan AA aspartic protease
MGLIYVKGKVSNGGKSSEIKFLVDSGASYSLLPKDVCNFLGLNPDRSIELILADGTVISRGVTECLINLMGFEGHTPVIIGEDMEDEALLGAVTLEIFGLLLDPLKREIRPAKMMLK